ncbi:hypothetical protein [Natronorubrum aibiense]
MQVTAIREVTCPYCGVRTSVSIPDSNTELQSNHTVTAFDGQRKVTCSNGHPYWVPIR